MLKVYTVNHYYQLNDRGAWFKVGTSFRILEDRSNLPDEEIVIDNWRWGEVMEFLEKNRINGFGKNETIFKKIPYFYCHDQYSKQIKFHFDAFATFSYKAVYKEDKNVTLDYIAKHFPADKCIQYIKEHGGKINDLREEN